MVYNKTTELQRVELKENKRKMSQSTKWHGSKMCCLSGFGIRPELLLKLCCPSWNKVYSEEWNSMKGRHSVNTDVFLCYNVYRVKWTVCFGLFYSWQLHVYLTIIWNELINLHLLCDQPRGLVVGVSATNHEVPCSIPGSTVAIFSEGEDSRGDHGLGRLVEIRFKGPPGTTSSYITTHIIETT